MNYKRKKKFGVCITAIAITTAVSFVPSPIFAESDLKFSYNNDLLEGKNDKEQDKVSDKSKENEQESKKNTPIYITFEPNNGSILDKMKLEDIKINKLPVPKKDGYDFDGWFMDVEFTHKFNENIKITNHITLYAKWKKSSSSSSSSSTHKSRHSHRSKHSHHHSRKSSKHERAIAKSGSSDISSKELIKEIHGEGVLENNLLLEVGLTEDDILRLYELDSSRFEGNIVVLQNKVADEEGDIINAHYVYVKCSNTEKDYIKVDVSDLDLDTPLYVYKIDALGNVEFVKEISSDAVEDDEYAEISVEDKQNYLISDCRLKTRKTGEMPKLKEGWNSQEGNWIYIYNGKPFIGWLKCDNGKWYHMNSFGIMDTGWIKDVDGKWYYLNMDGSMAVNTTVDGYRLGFDGAWIE